VYGANRRFPFHGALKWLGFSIYAFDDGSLINCFQWVGLVVRLRMVKVVSCLL